MNQGDLFGASVAGGSPASDRRAGEVRRLRSFVREASLWGSAGGVAFWDLQGLSGPLPPAAGAAVLEGDILGAARTAERAARAARAAVAQAERLLRESESLQVTESGEGAR